LVSPLNGTVALPQVHHIAMAVGQNLKLDVAGAINKLFQINTGIAKGGFGFALGGHKGFAHFAVVMHQAHAATAAPSGGLNNHRVANSMAMA
jgi:hypothetical protein